MATPLLKRLFTVAEYHRMGEAGILGEDDRVELIEGEIVEMAPIGSRHAGTLKRLLDKFIPLQAAGRIILSVQDPIDLGERSEPQPDLILLKPRSDFYASSHPGPEEALLVVEVAETSPAYDREVKLPLYARAGIPEVWLVDLAEGLLEVYRQPDPRGYREVQRLQRDQRVAPQAFPDLELVVGDVLG
ncbi:MAG: Uma2 family endonuclease [Armatimonadota bacterium]|nr:Uma2 family endonuclease [Armatimonadota bacterium]